MNKLVTILAVAALTALAGCATISKLSTPSYSPFVQVAVDVAVATAVGTNVKVQPMKAAQIKSIAQQVLAADTGTNVALTAIEAVVNAKVAALKLQAADALAAQALTAALTVVLQTQLSSSTAATNVSAQTQVAVSLLMNDVIIATSAYGA